MKFKATKNNFPKIETFVAKWKGKNYNITENDEFYFYIDSKEIIFYYQHDGEEYPLSTIKFNMSLHLLNNEYYDKLRALEETEFKVETILNVNNIIDVDAIFEKMINVLKSIPDVEDNDNK